MMLHSVCDMCWISLRVNFAVGIKLSIIFSEEGIKGLIPENLGNRNCKIDVKTKFWTF